MNISQITYFLEVSNTLNFTTAAHNLYVAQPSLSKQIANLEEELGVALLVRDRRHVELTPAGKVFQAKFSRILEDMNEAIKQVKEAGKEKKEIRIGIFQPLSSHEFFPDLMRVIIREFPDYEISIQRLKFQELKRAYDRNEINLVLTIHVVTGLFADAHSVRFERLHRGIIYMKEYYPENPDFCDFNGKKLITISDAITPGQGKMQRVISEELGIQMRDVVETGDVVNSLMYIYPKDGFAFMDDGVAQSIGDKVGYLPVNMEKYAMTIDAIWNEKCSVPFERIFQNHDFNSILE